MRLTSRLTTVLILGILTLMMLDLFIILKHENAEMTQDMRMDASRMGSVVSQIISDLWELGGEARAIEVLQQIDAATETAMHTAGLLRFGTARYQRTGEP